MTRAWSYRSFFSLDFLKSKVYIKKRSTTQAFKEEIAHYIQAFQVHWEYNKDSMMSGISSGILKAQEAVSSQGIAENVRYSKNMDGAALHGKT